MAYVVEDGTGVADANSYVAVAFADGFFADRGNASWAALSEAQKQAALVRATDYIEQKFDSRWRGSRVNGGQSLGWPREDVYENGEPDRLIADNVVPVRVKQAACELALRAHDDALLPDVASTETVVNKEKVGSLEVGYEVVQRALSPSYPAVNATLRPLLRSSNTVEVFRS
jgi:hypothetical protein